MSDAEASRSEQLARNINELVQELRVAQAGVQILFGFLLSIAFTERYAAAGDLVRTTHLITVGFAAGAVAALGFGLLWFGLPPLERSRGPAPERVDPIPKN